MNEASVIGIDIAKSVFQLHGVDKTGHPVLRKQVKRANLMELVANLPQCLIAMEACGGSNHWAREFRKHGHEVRLIAPQFVKPYVKSNKNDANDAEAIAEAATKVNMRFVPIKEAWQQDIQCIHRVRQRLVRTRVTITNELHSLLLEYGVALPRSESQFFKGLALILDPASERLSASTKEVVSILVEEFEEIAAKISICERKLKSVARVNPLCQRLQTIPGVGLMTSTAVVAAAADPKLFKNGRQFSAWLGLVPKQHSSGGKSVLLGISKRGDSYIRSLLIHGGRAVLHAAKKKNDPLSKWLLEKERTRGANKTAVALANKNARVIWALMSSGEEYRAAA